MEDRGNFPENVQEERRRFPRLIASVDVEYSVLGQEAVLEKKTVTKNIGGGGICLIVYEKIEPGTLLALKIHLPDINYIVSAQGKVIWSDYFAVGQERRERYDLGIEFINIKEADREKISQYIFKYKGD